MPLSSPWLEKVKPGGGDVAWSYVLPGGDPVWECVPWFCACGLEQAYPTLPWNRLTKVRVMVATSEPEGPGWAQATVERDEDACFRGQVGEGAWFDLHNAPVEWLLGDILGLSAEDEMRVEEDPKEWVIWVRWEAA